MPQETRPLSSLRLGTYDNPPASTASEPVSTPQTRSGGLRRALREMRARDPASPRAVDTLPMPTSGARRSIYTGTGGTAGTRRRRRSSSPHSETNENNDDENEPRNSLSHPASDLDDRLRRQRHKRRRLLPFSPSSASSSTAPKKAIKYGYYGQVAPGRLQLELISCDGGEHRDPRNPATSLGPENLLRHDKSVYCSERPYANVVLRHADEGTAFCLEKLWIVGPEGGFTAPVREGMVHVAMTLADLHKYIDPPPHARLSRFNTSPRRDRRERLGSLRSSPERLTLAEALRDPEVVAAYQEIVNEDDSPRPPSNTDPNIDSARSIVSNVNNTSFNLAAFNTNSNRTSDNASHEPHCIENDTLSTPRPIALLTDEDPGPEDTSPQEVLDYRLQRLRLARRRLEAENSERAERWAGMNRLDALMARSRVRDEEGEAETEEPGETSTPPPAAAATAAPAELHIRSTPERIASSQALSLLDPDPLHANTNTNASNAVTTTAFHIAPHKHRVGLRFDPPLSGRFLLLKLSPDPGRGNVDVQSVVAVGFGGGRFFPAVAVR